MDTAAVLRTITSGRNLDEGQARALFEEIMSGQVAEPLLAAILAGLATKGEAASEIVGAARAMRGCVLPVRLPEHVAAIDTCGTGGDGHPTFNVSSTVAIVAAAAGATVAKHGNRSNARPSGSAEGLQALGINVDADVPALERCLREARVAFLYAIKLHPAMKHAAPVRRALGIRTIFNLLGPLTNPAGVRRQLLGVNQPGLVRTLGHVLAELGAERAMVVHGAGGLCDLSIAGPSTFARWDGQALTVERVTPEELGLRPAPLDTLYVDSPAASAAVIERVLNGEAGPAREMVLLNAAAALWVADLAADWAAGLERARAVLDSGAARATLERWRAGSHESGTWQCPRIPPGEPNLDERAASG